MLEAFAKSGIRRVYIAPEHPANSPPDQRRARVRLLAESSRPTSALPPASPFAPIGRLRRRSRCGVRLSRMAGGVPCVTELCVRGSSPPRLGDGADSFRSSGHCEREARREVPLCVASAVRRPEGPGACGRRRGRSLAVRRGSQVGLATASGRGSTVGSCSQHLLSVPPPPYSTRRLHGASASFWSRARTAGYSMAQPGRPPAKRRATISLDAFTGSEKEIGLMAAGHSEHAEGLTPPRRPVRGAAQVRKRLRRELRRVGADGVSLYIDGPRGIARLRFPRRDRWLELAPGEALDLLRSLPDGAGAQATVDALARGS